MPWHFGWDGYATGDIANVLTAVVGDPNTGMHENKALTCSVAPGRLRRAVSRRGDDGMSVHPRALDYTDSSWKP